MGLNPGYLLKSFLLYMLSVYLFLFFLHNIQEFVTKSISNNLMTKIISTTTQTTTTTTVSATTMGPETLSKEAEKIRNLLKVGISLTDTSGLASTLSTRDFEIRFVSIDKFPLTPLL